MQYKQAQQGFFLVEVVVASSVIAVVLVLLLGAIQNTVEVSQRSLERTQAAYLLEEGAEAVKLIRSQAWSSISGLTNGTTYYLSWSGSAWILTTSLQKVDGFTRTIVFSSVSRDGNNDIVSSGGTVDVGTRRVTITTSWVVPSGTQTESLSLYITNI